MPIRQAPSDLRSSDLRAPDLTHTPGAAHTPPASPPPVSIEMTPLLLDAVARQAQRQGADVDLGSAAAHVTVNLGFAESGPTVNRLSAMRGIAQANRMDLSGTLHMVMSALSSHPRHADALIDTVRSAETTLRGHGIDTPDKLFDTLGRAQKWDTVMGLSHGLAAAKAFNLGTAVVDNGGAVAMLKALGSDLNTVTLGQWAGLGFLAGVGLSVYDVMTVPAVEKTFQDAYYTRPETQHMPAWVLQANDEQREYTTKALAKDLSNAFGIGFGAVNAARFIAQVGTVAVGGSPSQAATMDSNVDIVGGFPGGSLYRVVRNGMEESRGMAGVQHLLARKDLGAMLTALDGSALEQAANGGVRLARFAKNVVTTLPEGLMRAATTASGFTSHAVLGGFVAAAFPARAAVKDALPGLDEGARHLVGELVKLSGIQAMCHAYGAAMGVASRNDCALPALLKSGVSNPLAGRADHVAIEMPAD